MFLASSYNAAVSLAQEHHPGRKALLIGGLVAVAAVSIWLGVSASQPHHVTSYVPAVRQAATLTANPTGSQDTLALVTTVAGAVSALAAIGSMAVAFVAWRRPAKA